jgi:hypothetical protein
MALIDKIQNNGNQPSKVDSSIDLINLDPKEIEFILLLIKNSQFRGEDIEFIYNLILKIQKIYLFQNSK